MTKDGWFIAKMSIAKEQKGGEEEEEEDRDKECIIKTW